ncbi:MAG: prepilin-type N-terminal cleavage/methylation domain-containing protein [Patescibacteria group bacterium]|jgi:prepilin-type N-terminal cleavage/methylation domain-containing protein|nr:prepilin-type N-terminal cleavage/methylation domain-containing protein [Patescibacteria group bacterium]
MSFIKLSGKISPSFTLIELLIVIAILAVLMSVIVITINPTEMLKRTRDVRRLSDLKTLNSALSVYSASNPDGFFGNLNTVYISIPDSSPTCANLGLPALPTGWSYACSNSTNYRKTDGAGWIPINLKNLDIGSPISALPIDPINSTTSGQYYTYVVGGSWELNAILESDKYRNDKTLTKQNFPGVLSFGSNINLSPIFNNSGLVGYWSFDEGSDTIAYDYSGNNNHGTLYNGPQWVNGKIGKALSFDGMDDYVDCGTSTVFDMNTNDFTIAVWARAISGISRRGIINKGGWSGSVKGYAIQQAYTPANKYYFVVMDDTGYKGVPTSLLETWDWSFIVGKKTTNHIEVWTNGMNSSAYDTTINSLSNPIKPFEIGKSATTEFFNGLIDEVRIYNRALSEAEIKALYNATK